MDHGPGSLVAGEQSVHSPCTESDAWAVDGNTDRYVEMDPDVLGRRLQMDSIWPYYWVVPQGRL